MKKMTLPSPALTDLTLMAQSLRALSVDMVEAAQSGHPGAPLGLADVVAVLYGQFLRFDAENPDWVGRDRVVFSNGHASALVYSALHLAGYEVSLDELKGFRQLGSALAGHPEYGEVAGVEVTTGPLGQGVGMAAGMALGCKKRGLESTVYCVLGDGCLMEGVSHEAFELAVSLGLDNLVFLFDDNNITIDGAADAVCKTDILARMQAYGLETLAVDGHDLGDIYKGLAVAKGSERPFFLACKTKIGKFSPVAETSAAHGAPLGAAGAQVVKENIGWHGAPFTVGKDVYAAWERCAERRVGEKDVVEVCSYEAGVRVLERLVARESATLQTVATRVAGGLCLAELAKVVPNLVSGSADLTGSVNTRSAEMIDISAEDWTGNFMAYGVREHGMGALMNGLAREGFLPVSGTFLSFADYMKEPIRLAALMRLPSVFVLTHDSIGLGEDGPTHQPVEQLAMLRSIPSMAVFRPADVVETARCWQEILRRAAESLPSCLVLTRQKVPPVGVSAPSAAAYVVKEVGDVQVQLLASGSEVQVALAAADILAAEGVGVRVISVPEMESLADLEVADADAPALLTVAVEAAHPMPWYKWADEVIGMETFGASGKGADVMAHFGFTGEYVAGAVRALLG